MPTIHTCIEKARGCGYRKPGGLYLIAGGLARHCDMLPIPLIACQCCGSGIKPARGFTWINSNLFDIPCYGDCNGCAISRINERMGLIWIGEKFYPTPEAFTKEAANHGISRRIACVPKDFKIGETWICIAHRKAIPKPADACEDLGIHSDGTAIVEYIPGLFHAFKPTAIEYVVTGNETTEELEKLESRGFTLINVIRDIDAQKKMQI